MDDQAKTVVLYFSEWFKSLNRQFHRKFAHYNMFNDHFFNKKERENFCAHFIGAKKLMLVIDPPYGGLLEALADSLEKIKLLLKIQECHILLFFPYYMEHQVKKYLPFLAMSDYKVNYSNHSGYGGGQHPKARGSPARIYTDIPLNSFVLPANDYRYCEVCCKYVHKLNNHCTQCNECTTKDGPTYYHCDICKKCTKPSRYHCRTCGCCVMKDHVCDSNQQEQGYGCYICGDKNHKKISCTNRNKVKTQKSTDTAENLQPLKKKKRK